MAPHCQFPVFLPPECHLPSDPLLHPVAHFQRKIINLNRMYDVSHTFRLVYYGSNYNSGCELKSGVLYYVQRHNKTTFTYNHLEDGKGVTSLCPGQRIWLGTESYGFVSCGEGQSGSRCLFPYQWPRRNWLALFFISGVIYQWITVNCVSYYLFIYYAKVGMQ